MVLTCNFSLSQLSSDRSPCCVKCCDARLNGTQSPGWKQRSRRQHGGFWIIKEAQNEAKSQVSLFHHPIFSQIYPEMKISQLHGQEIIKPAPSEDDRVENAIQAVGMGEYDTYDATREELWGSPVTLQFGVGASPTKLPRSAAGESQRAGKQWDEPEWDGRTRPSNGLQEIGVGQLQQSLVMSAILLTGVFHVFPGFSG